MRALRNRIDRWSKNNPWMKTKLEVWKEGTLVEEVDLSTPRAYIIGRSEETSDIVTDHISCSRRHAQLVVEASGSVSITDLNSAQGTWADNTELRPGEPTPLRDTSKLTFGASTRTYLLKLDRPQAAAAVGGAGQLSVQEKRKLLWGNKKGASGVSLTHQRAAEVNATGWSAHANALGDGERQDKFLSMMGAKRHKSEADDTQGPASSTAAAAETARQRQEAMFNTLEHQYHQASGGKRRGL